jgi:hypothetical protein
MSNIILEESMMSDFVELREYLQNVCIKFSNIRAKIDNEYKEKMNSGAFKALVESSVSRDIVGYINSLNMQTEKYLESTSCQGGKR